MSQAPAPGALTPQGPSNAGFLPQWPVLRKKQVFVVPIVAIVVGALITALLLVLEVITAPAQALFAVVVSVVTAIVGILFLLWLDRWEPEPPHLLVAAFLWGSGVSLLLLLFIGYPLAQALVSDGEFFLTAIAAPLLEESAKGLFLVLVLLTSRRGRAEFNSLTDAIVYGGFVGIGFTFIEDIGYIARGETFGQSILTAVFRIGFGAWLHSLFTIMTAIGLWLCMTNRGPVRFVYPVLGWLVAVLLHAVNNGSTFLSLGAVFGGLLLIQLPATIAIIILAVRSYRREGETVRSQLPIMVHNGWVTPQEASWLGNLRSRKQAIAHAKTQGRAERDRIAAFRDNVTELAHVRHRLDRLDPPYPAELVQHHDDLVALLVADKQWVAQQLPPAPPTWQQFAPTPGLEFPAPSPHHAPPPPQQAPQPQPPHDPDATRLRGPF